MRIPVEGARGVASGFKPVARWLAAASILLILYGSLYPFRFSDLGDFGLFELIRSLAFQRTSRADLVANLLLYMPLGLCLMLGAPAKWSRLQSFGWATAFGTLLSIAVELLQVHTSLRVSSLTDVVLNATGTAAGALIAILYLALGHTIRVPGFASARPEPVPFGVLLLWFAFRLAPFAPSFDWQKYKTALQPLFQDLHFSASDTFRYFVGWLTVGYAVRQVWRREYAIQAMAVSILIVLLGRIVIIGKALVPSELLGLLLCIPAGVLLAMVKDRRRAIVLAVLLVALVVLQGLQPFNFTAQAHNFSWVPFKNSLSDRLEVNYAVLLEKCFWYFTLVWLLVRRGFGAGSAALAVAALLSGIEAVQTWLPGRSAEITDPLLALVAGMLVALLGAGPMMRSTSSSRR